MGTCDLPDSYSTECTVQLHYIIMHYYVFQSVVTWKELPCGHVV